MALIVFIRGINVGGHRRFRPSILASQLHRYGVESIGATGTFIVRKPGSRSAFRALLRKKIPFAAEIMMCNAKEIVQLVADNPFVAASSRADQVRFVSILDKAPLNKPPVPLDIPPNGEWYVRVIQTKGRFVVGTYRRHMKTIGYLGQLDKVFGVPATTRGWNTILAVARRLEIRV